MWQLSLIPSLDAGCSAAPGNGPVRRTLRRAASSLLCLHGQTSCRLIALAALLSVGAGCEAQVGDEPSGGKIAGVAHQPDGKPAASLSVWLVGDFSQKGPVKTDAQGRFEFRASSPRMRGGDNALCVLARDTERLLAAAQDVEDAADEINLQLAPAITFAGRAVCEGAVVTNATAAVIFWCGNRGFHLRDFTAGTNVPGNFEIQALPTGRRYGVVVSAPGHGQQSLYQPEDAGEPGRRELQAVELKPARLKLAGTVVDEDDKPIADASVNMQGEGQPTANVRSDREGRFHFDQVCEGSVRLYANAQGGVVNTTAEGGDTNVVLRLSQATGVYPSGESHKLKGKVTDADGKPVSGAVLSVFPSGRTRGIKSGADGAFSLTWGLESWQIQQGENAVLVVRDPARKLATAEELSEEVTNLTVRLKPAVTLVGQVQNISGKTLAGAEVGLYFKAGRSYSGFDEEMVKAGADGRYRISGLPAGQSFMVFAGAEGHGRVSQQIETEDGVTQVEVEPFELKSADQVLAGQVLNSADKPLSGADITVSGDNQPQTSAKTDKQGRFSLKVCEGTVQLFVNDQNGGYANGSAEAGDTNVVLQIGNESGGRQAPRRASLRGKPLPDLALLGLEPASVPEGKPVLLCLLDVEQPSSRYFVSRLAADHAVLKQKGLTVLAATAVDVPAEGLKEWQAANPVPFAVGRVSEQSAKTLWATAVEATPWLILADKNHRVVVEGFDWDDLEAKIKGVLP